LKALVATNTGAPRRSEAIEDGRAARKFSISALSATTPAADLESFGVEPLREHVDCTDDGN
jgi:hypothetical protein